MYRFQKFNYNYYSIRKRYDNSTDTLNLLARNKKKFWLFFEINDYKYDVPYIEFVMELKNSREYWIKKFIE